MYQELNMTPTGSIFALMECDDNQWLPLTTRPIYGQRALCRKHPVTPTSKSKLPSWRKGNPRNESRGK
ncbi:hypothetical protein CEXT_191391 [Caerostris extrusa]|uniref:Uncharacterized protein n=1 Tax=Caerostris extrusa TaxID=172846 RepID=A0AAV4YBN4_CAEEX|nr:hypothetical protein CEXT_191391 [Caerostris extrusa]